MKIAFYAPLKSPEHHKPSGDRQMARALIKALEMAGHEVRIVSHIRSFSKTPHSQSQIDQIKSEANNITQETKKWGAQVWFSYHAYYKAPDFIGLQVSQALGLTIITAEASLAKKRNNGEWAENQSHVVSLLKQSSANFYFTDRDFEGLKGTVEASKLFYLPPFIQLYDSRIDHATKNKQRQTSFATIGQISLVTMGMMRGGVKSQSYQFLAQALGQLKQSNWHLSIIGDGSHRSEVESYFSGFSKHQITWLGELAPKDVATELATHDVFLWPGFGEAYGLAYLEAQSCGLPVIALKTHGVPWVVKDGETGILVEPDKLNSYVTAIEKLSLDADLRERMSIQARKFVHTERSLKSASSLIDSVIRQVDD